MSAVLQKARGAAAFSYRELDIPDYPEVNAARFDWQPIESEWGARLAQLKKFRSLEDDWDGDGSCAPGADLADGAISLAQCLQKQGYGPPDRVVVGVNGTIFLEWHAVEGYYEVEVHSPTEAEARWVREGSDQVEVSMFGRGRTLSRG